MSQPSRARTKGEAVLDLHYAVRLHFLHCRFYRRIRALLTFVSLGAGSAAFALALQWLPGGVGVMGVVVAACSILDATGNFAEKAMLHKQWREQLLDLLARSAPMDLQAIDAEWRLLKRGMDNEIESLRPVAMNDNLKSFGYESSMRPETRLQRLVRAIA